MQIQIQIGLVLLTVFLFTELVINVFFEFFKNHIFSSRLRHLLHNGKTICLGPENTFAAKFGLGTGVRTTDLSLNVIKAAKYLVKVLVLLVVGWWESGLSEDFFTTATPTVLTRNALPSPPVGSRLQSRDVSFVSPIPYVPLTETLIDGFPGKDDVEQNNRGSYAKQRSISLQIKYFSTCIQGGSDGFRRAYGAFVRRADAPQDIGFACLDGKQGREKFESLSFNPDQHQKNVSISSISFLRKVTNYSVSTLYAVVLITKSAFVNGSKRFSGYVTLTFRSHFDNDVIWSLYGFVLGPGPNMEMLRVLVEIDRERTSIPCKEQQCLGFWKFSQGLVSLPNGEEYVQQPDGNRLESIQLCLKSCRNGMDLAKCNMNLCLPWLAETAFRRFKAEEKFTDDVLRRLSGSVFFLSDMGLRQGSFRAFERKRGTKIKPDRTFVLIVSLCVLVLFAGVGIVADETRDGWDHK